MAKNEVTKTGAPVTPKQNKSSTMAPVRHDYPGQAVAQQGSIAECAMGHRTTMHGLYPDMVEGDC